MRRNGRLVAAATPLALLLAACAGSLHPAAERAARSHTSTTTTVTAAARRARLCRPQALTGIARELRVKRSAVTTSTSVVSNGMPQCTFRVGHGTRMRSVTVNIDNAPQVDWRLARTVEEASQIFGLPPPGWQAPVGLFGLDPNASWFPTSGELMAANGKDLFTVTIRWPGASRAARIRLARTAVTPYMKGGHLPGPKAVTGYPGGK